MTNSTAIDTARTEYSNYCQSIGTTAISEENAILNAGRESLPPCALDVLDGEEPTVEYYGFLTAQTEAAQDEREAEYRAGRESTL